jgi:tetratricopeptide (TPR) repeat protein
MFAFFAHIKLEYFSITSSRELREFMTPGIGKTAVILCFALFVISLSTTQYAESDLWWHLKLGETVYNTGHIYSADDFSYTYKGQKQFNGEWLADLIIFLSFKMGGFFGINILKLSVLLPTFLLLFLMLKNTVKDEETGFFAILLTLILVFLSLRFRLYVRPYIFSYLFFSLFLFIINHYDKNRRTYVLYLLPVIEIVWSNMSVGAVFGPLLLGSYIAGLVVKKQTPLVVPVMFVAVAGAAMVNPEAFRIYTLAFNLASDPYSKTVGEYQPLSFDILWGHGLSYSFIWSFQILVIGSLVYLVFMRGWKNLYHLLLFAGFLIQTVVRVRMIEFFSLVAALLFISPAEKLTETLLAPLLSRRTLISAGASVLILAAAVPSLTDKAFLFGTGIKEGDFPDRALAFVEKNNIQGNMFNSYGIGGYLIWHSPERKVFIDGRYRRLYSTGFYGDYLEMCNKPDAWKLAEERWGFEYALLEYNLRTWCFPRHLMENRNWALVYWDDHSLLYLKRTEKNRPIIDKYEYRVAKPNLYDFSYLEPYLHSGISPQLIGELDREILLNPSNQEPRLAKVFLLFNAGKSYSDEVLRELDICQGLKPDIAMKHSALAFILLEKGQADRAKDEFRKALALNPHDPAANYLKGKF